MPEPVWNCQTCLPSSMSSAMNSPVSLPVAHRRPPVTRFADPIDLSVSGTRHFCLPVSGSTASMWPHGKETGEFIALDIEDGKQVWQFQTGSGINAQPITYTHNGRQYVTALSGIGGLYWNVARDKLKDTVPQGGSVWTFAILPEGRQPPDR